MICEGGIVTYIKDDQDRQAFLDDLWAVLEASTKPNPDATMSRINEIVPILTDMKADTKNIYSFVRSNPRIFSLAPGPWERFKDAIAFINELRFYGNRVLLVLDRNPKIWTLTREKFDERVKHLRKLGLVEGSLQKVILTWPSVLTLKRTRINVAVEMLKSCLFSRPNITTIIINSPELLAQDPADIERLFQYVYYTMELRSQDEMVTANLFKYSLSHVHRRHTFLERLGVYEPPNKKGHTRSRDNPKLARIIDCSDTRFAAKCAGGIPVEDYRVFVRNLEEEERDEMGEGADDDSDKDSDDEYYYIQDVK